MLHVRSVIIVCMLERIVYDVDYWLRGRFEKFHGIVRDVASSKVKIDSLEVGSLKVKSQWRKEERKDASPVDDRSAHRGWSEKKDASSVGDRSAQLKKKWKDASPAEDRSAHRECNDIEKMRDRLKTVAPRIEGFNAIDSVQRMLLRNPCGFWPFLKLG